MNVNQRNETRNQSTADFSKNKVFLFDNRYSQGILKNNSDPEATWTLKTGQIVYRQWDGTLAIYGTAVNIVGVLNIDGDIDVLAGDSLSVDYCTKGTVNGLELLDIDGNVLDISIISINGLSIKDNLENIGLHVDTSTVQHTKFDN